MPDRQPTNAWVSFLAHLLFILVAWTLFIKYLFPIGYSLAYGEPLARPNYTRVLAMGMAVIEILIICTLFVRFLGEPDWTIWRTNWFVNKAFVLTCFALVLGTALCRPNRM